MYRRLSWHTAVCAGCFNICRGNLRLLEARNTNPLFILAPETYVRPFRWHGLRIPDLNITRSPRRVMCFAVIEVFLPFRQVRSRPNLRLYLLIPPPPHPITNP